MIFDDITWFAGGWKEQRAAWKICANAHPLYQRAPHHLLVRAFAPPCHCLLTISLRTPAILSLYYLNFAPLRLPTSYATSRRGATSTYFYLAMHASLLAFVSLTLARLDSGRTATALTSSNASPLYPAHLSASRW